MIHNNTEAPFTTAAKLRNQDPLVRAELEARILAKQPHDQIAVDMNLPIEAVTAFELNYFDIRHLLDNPTWVRHYILGGESDHVLDPSDVTKFWHHVAYFYGITFLKPFLCQVTRSTLRREGLIAYLRPSNPLPMRLKCFVARACCPYLRGKRRMATACYEAARKDWLDCLNWVAEFCGIVGLELPRINPPTVNTGHDSRRLGSASRWGQGKSFQIEYPPRPF